MIYLLFLSIKLKGLLKLISVIESELNKQVWTVILKCEESTAVVIFVVFKI